MLFSVSTLIFSALGIYLFRNVIYNLRNGLELLHGLELEIELFLDGKTHEQHGEGVDAQIHDERRIHGHFRQIALGLDGGENLFQAGENLFSCHGGYP